jgi:hypothetical protein
MIIKKYINTAGGQAAYDEGAFPSAVFIFFQTESLSWNTFHDLVFNMESYKGKS